MNHSPWLKQLNSKRKYVRLTGKARAEAVIVGAGIAGITTAYYLLTKTDKQVIILEADRLAHGATGHNAGQVTSYLERPFVQLVEEFGLKLACEGVASIEHAWNLLEEILEETSLPVPFYHCHGYAGYSTLEQLLLRLDEESLRRKGGLAVREWLIIDDPAILLRIPDDLLAFCRIVSRQDIKDVLETDSDLYIAAKASRKGCLNSALFCEQLVSWFDHHYPNRFALFEKTPVNSVDLSHNEAICQTDQGEVIAERVILCTNGFENIKLKNHDGLDIDGRFHEKLYGTIGYMAGYHTKENRPPAALSYFEEKSQEALDPYIYLTRRPTDYKEPGARGENLVCLGGPEVSLGEKASYNRHEHGYPEWAAKEIDEFMKRTYRNYPKDMDFDYIWHGLMGYTVNGVRLVGFEPCNHRLLYNLGCNGVGILPSIFGAERISKLIKGEVLPISIFDPQDQRCLLPET